MRGGGNPEAEALHDTIDALEMRVTSLGASLLMIELLVRELCADPEPALVSRHQRHVRR